MHRLPQSALFAVVLFSSVFSPALGHARANPWYYSPTSESTPVPTPADLDLNTSTTSINFDLNSTDASQPPSEFETSALPIDVESTVSTFPTEVVDNNQSTVQPIDIESTFVTDFPIDEQSTQGGNTVRPRGSRRPPVFQTLPPVDFDCQKKLDGYYADPKDKCSSKFFACVGGTARQLFCGSNLVYEPESGTCERRHESFRCSGVQRRTTTTSRPRTPPAKLPIDCTKRDDGWYSDPQKKCSHTFYACSNGAGSRFDCPANSYFDLDTISCQQFDNVTACSGKKPIVRPTTPAPTPLPKEHLPVDCENSPSGVYADPSKKCSHVYYVCSNGDGFKSTCPDKLYFDPQEKLCDFFDDVFVCSGKTRPTQNVTVTPPIPTIASLPASEFNCTGKPDRAFLLDTQKCSNAYYRCFNEFSYKLKCPENLYFDLESDMCDSYSDVFACSGKKKPKSTTVKPIPAEKLPMDCGKSKDGDYPDPAKKCSSTYYSCSNAVGTRRKCPRGTYYDKVYSYCDAREYVQECGGKPRPSPKPTSKYPVTKSPYKCNSNGDGNYSTGKCASRYYICVSGTPINADCPYGTYYDHELDQCGYKDEIPACGGIRPTTKKPAV